MGTGRQARVSRTRRADQLRSAAVHHPGVRAGRQRRALLQLRRAARRAGDAVSRDAFRTATKRSPASSISSTCCPAIRRYSDFFRIAWVEVPASFVPGSAHALADLAAFPQTLDAKIIDCPVVPHGSTATEGDGVAPAVDDAAPVSRRDDRLSAIRRTVERRESSDLADLRDVRPRTRGRLFVTRAKRRRPTTSYSAFRAIPTTRRCGTCISTTSARSISCATSRRHSKRSWSRRGRWSTARSSR